MTKTQTPRSRKQQQPSASGEPATPAAPVFARILCAVDGTHTSTAAVKTAAALAGPDGHLTLLAVTAVSGSGAYAAAAIAPGRAELVLANARRIANRAGVSASTVVDPGRPPADVILRRAAGYDLFAIGAPATSWLGDALLGGVATVALSHFTTPMLVVRRSSAGPLRGRRVLVASDGDEGSDRIVQLAGRLGQSQGAQVTLVNALGPESRMSPHAIAAQQRALQRILPDAPEPRIAPGKPWDVILEAAQDTDAALVVIGSRRVSGLRALGSVSRRVVHDAPCSVLVVPPGR
ncbi:MAG TPA: universal stress protein [Solirubrobacteraceae bacterium]|nr:universal stress protein [Solirubrobacteraceae bacterium]